MTPIAKNVIVVDSQGNILEATYPKRAKGLVKNGRARFMDENKICLACPPNILEDKTMNNNETMIDMTTGEVVETTNQEPKLSVEYILTQLERISSQSAHINDAITKISQMQVSGAGDIGTQEKASAIADIVKSRETTNQRMISLYEKMYDSLTRDSTNQDNKIKYASELIRAIDSDVLDGDDIIGIIKAVIG